MTEPIKILLCTRKGKGLVEKRAERMAEELLRERLEEKGVAFEVMRDENLDWTKMRKTIRGRSPWDRLYYKVAGMFDLFVLIEDENGLLAKGQYSLASYAAERKKRVRVWRESRTEAVERVQIYDPDGWKQGYGRVILKGRG